MCKLSNLPFLFCRGRTVKSLFAQFWVPVALANILSQNFALCDSISDFQAEYSQGAQRLEQDYSHLRLSSDETRNDGDGKFFWEMRADFLREGSLIRATLTRVRSGDPEYPIGTVSSFGGTAAKFFSFYEDPGDTAARFEWYGPKPNFDANVRLSCMPLYAPFCALDLRLSDFFKRQDVRIASVGETLFDGEKVVEAVTEESTPHGGIRRRHFFFRPHSWALAGWEMARDGDKVPGAATNLLKGRILYKENTDPLELVSVETWAQRPNQAAGTKPGRRFFEIKSIQFGPLPEDLFSPEALGQKSLPPTAIPDQGGATTNPEPGTTQPQPTDPIAHPASTEPNVIPDSTNSQPGETIVVPVPFSDNLPTKTRLLGVGALAATFLALGIYFGVRGAKR
jgi:hypothetical protein